MSVRRLVTKQNETTMTAPVSQEDFTARAEALEECAEHLGLPWTDDPREWRAGEWLARKLRKEALSWRNRAAKNVPPNVKVNRHFAA